MVLMRYSKHNETFAIFQSSVRYSDCFDFDIVKYFNLHSLWAIDEFALGRCEESHVIQLARVIAVPGYQTHRTFAYE